VTATICVLSVGLASPTSARADDPGVAVSIESMTPTLWASGSTLSISGAVANNTDADLRGARVVLWASTTAITTVADFDAALTGDPTSPTGQALVGAEASVPLGTGGVLPSRTQASFTVQGQPKLATAGAAYLVGVQVVDSRGKVLSRARLMLTAPSDSPAIGALVVPLTARPSLVTPGNPDADPPVPALFRDDGLADDLNGNLGKLIALAGQPGVTAVIDPALVDALTQLAAGYIVASDPGATATPGKGSDAAKAALTSIDTIIAGGNAYRSPSSDPDVAALMGLPQPASILAQATQVPSDALAALPVAVVAGGAITDQTRAVVDGVGPQVVLSDALQPSATLQAGDDGVPWVALTPSASISNLTGPLPDFGGAPALQPALNRTALLTIASAQGAPIVTLADAGDVASVNAWNDGKPAGLKQLLATLQPSPFDWRTDAPGSSPSPELITAVTQTQQDLAVLADLGNQQAAAGALGNRVLPGAVASSWSGDWPSALAWLQQSTSDLATQTDGSVSLHVAAQWMLSSRDNRVPITITNDMGMPVSVMVRFESENPARLSIPDADAVTVPAKSSTTVIVNPLAEANGSVRVRVVLVTVNGNPVGVPQDVQVVTTSAGRMGWVIIIGAGLAFVILTSLRVRQVRRQRAGSKTAEGGEAHVEQ